MSGLLAALVALIDQAIAWLTQIEIHLGQEKIGLATAVFFTLLTFFSQFFSTARRAGWSKALAQGLIRCSWVFPIIYIPYTGGPMWAALLFTTLISTGTWLLLRRTAREEQPRRRPRPINNRPEIDSQE